MVRNIGDLLLPLIREIQEGQHQGLVSDGWTAARFDASCPAFKEVLWMHRRFDFGFAARLSLSVMLDMMMI
jgi:hypothetical protein